MKMIKRIVATGVITFAVMLLLAVTSKAATVKVTADTLNLRKEPTTKSNIVTLLSKGNTCELLEEDGDWYKVKYKTYTGYVSKEYVKKNEDTTSPNTSTPTTTTKPSDEQTPSESNTPEQVTGKTNKAVDVKLVPLIYSSKIDNLAKNTTVTIVSEVNGWSYIETNSVAGWIRSDTISDKKTTSTSQDRTNNGKDDDKTTTSSDNDKTTTYKEKTMYIGESAVNVRKEPNTSSKIMMELALNTKITVIGESGNWYQVKTSQGNGYILKKLLSSTQKTTSRGGIVPANIKTNSASQVASTKEATSVTNEKVTATLATQTTVSNTNTGAHTNANTNATNTEKGQKIVAYAKQFLGVPYVYGGASKKGFDCSGFTMYVYKNFGISMRHGAQAQAKIGREIKVDKKSETSIKKNLQPGDLVFFLDYETMDEIGHCGIYIGDGKFIHASSGSGYCVKINSLLPGEYYNTRFCAARRVI